MGRREGRRREIILVVDDEVEFHELIRAIFSATHDIMGVTNVEDALRALRSTNPNVVLLDVHLPRRPGWELLRKLGRQNGAPPVIVITADARNQVRVQAEELGAACAVFKPIVPRQLRKMVQMLEEGGR